ncbi:MAG: anthranilate synthase component I family protein [Myxococcota bacterium]
MPRVHVEQLGGGLDPGRIAARLDGRPGLLWLDADGRSERGRYAFVGSDPVQVCRRRFAEGDPWTVFDELGEPAPPLQDAADGPPTARVPWWAGYVSYDATWAAGTRTPPRHERPEDVTTAWLARYDAWTCFDRIGGRAWLVGDDVEACVRLRARLAGEAGPVPARVGSPRSEPAPVHLDAIARAKEHIAAGDIYQVNLARRWWAPFEGRPLGLAIGMHHASPVPLGFFLDAGDHAVVSRTMETFLEWDGAGGELRTRPIKGTIARHGRDAREAARLRTDTKERAEHAMIVDLMRNDLGRVAVPGTVAVRDTMAVEPYAKLSHLVSTVRCRTRQGTRRRDVLEATFPPGSVTGTPKVRAIELIEALERGPRGVYCGAVGHVTRTGGMRWAVAIRTAQITGGRVTYHAGGGIVEASDPERELAEADLKARAFLDAF